MSAPALFECSPRPHGNSDTATELFAEGLGAAGMAGITIPLRKFTILPCIGCGRCGRDPGGRCFQERDDESRALFRHLLEAPLAMFSSPIYFYHLPAQFKALIDRSQSFYNRKLAGDPALLNLPRRPAWVVLVAGRPRGERLFEGALLTMKYFLDVFNFRMEEPLLLRGMDGPRDLAEDEGASAVIRAAGERAARQCQAPRP
jgi:multimeric flavodoxin WrbA